MGAVQTWRLWRRLYLPPLLAWLASGVLLVFADRTLQHPLRRQRELDLRAEAIRTCDALNREGGESGPILSALFTRRSPDDRLIASAGEAVVLIDTDRDSTRWLRRPAELDDGVRSWRVETPHKSPGSPRDAPSALLLVGEGTRPDLRILWSRRAPESAGYAAPLRRGLILSWLLFGFLLVSTGSRGVRTVQRAVAALARLVREEPGRAGPERPGPERPGPVRAEPGRRGGEAEPSRGDDALARAPAGDDDLFDLAHELQRMRRHWESELTRSRQEMRERARLLEEMPEGIIAVDANRRLLLINRAACQLLEIGEAPALGARLSEVARNSDLQGFVEERFAGREGPADLDAGGGRRILEARGNLVMGADGRPQGFVLVLFDVTDVRRLDQIRKDFVANVSHELKTPLTNLRGYVETLLDGAQDDPATRTSFLETIHRNAERMHRIVEDLLNLSRIESQGRQIERQPIPLGEMLQRVVEDARAEAEAAEVRLRVEEETGNALFAGNLFMLERALTNLIDNAIKYGGRGKEIVLSARRSADQLHLEVRDQGPGIPPAHLGRLFERFYRVDRGRSRELGGTGLGLAIVKHVALAHGGEARVESEPGLGSTFSLTLPWVRPGE